MTSTRAATPAVVGRDQSVSAIVASMGGAQKSNRGAPAYSRWVNRPLGRRLAAVAHKLGATPNQVTAVSATLSLAGIVLLAVAPATWWAGVAVAVLLVLGYAFDAADGQLARLRGGGSPVGEWLDHVVDCTKTSLLHVAVLITMFRSFDLPDAALLVPLAFGAEATIFFFVIILTEQLRRAATPPVGSAPSGRSSSAAPVLRSLLVLPADYGLLCVTFVLLGAHTLFFWCYAALLAANVVFLLAALPRWYREVSSSGGVDRTSVA